MNDNLRMLHVATSLYMITLVMIWLRVLPHGMDGCSPQNYYSFFSVLFLDLVIFQSPLFPDEVGPYSEFQRSLINWFTPWVWDCFSSSLILHVWFYPAYFGCATAIWADVNISMKPEVTQTNYLYTWRTTECFHSIGPHAFGIGPALGRQSVLQVCPPVSWLWDTNKRRLLWSYRLIRGNMWCKVLNIADLFCYMAIYDLEIQLFRSFSVL